MKKNHFFRYLLALLLFGSNGVVAAGLSLSSGEIVLLRSLLGSAVLLALFWGTGQRFTAGAHRRELGFLLLSGAAMAADWLLLFEAYAQIGVSLGMLLNYCGPALVLALAPVVLRERISRTKAAALLAALAGAALISGGAASGGLRPGGILCAVLSAFAYAVMVLAEKKVHAIQGLENALLQLLAATVTVVVFLGLRQGLQVALLPGDWLPVLWLGLVNTGLGCFCYFSSIGQLPAHSVALCGYLEPLFAVLLSALVLNERLSALQWLGAALILGGAVCGECLDARRPPR